MSRTVIIGAGAAGLACAKKLRELDSDREIVIFDKDHDVPYERPPLSKALVGPGPMTGDPSVLTSAGIDLRIEEVISIDPASQVIITQEGETSYDQLVLAPGSTPRIAGWGTSALHNIHTLRDNSQLREALSHAKQAAVIGGGFIGAETASSLAKAGIHTHLIYRDEKLFLKRLGQEAAEAIEAIHTAGGVDLLPNASVAGIEKQDATWTIALDDGREILADLVISGIGANPDTTWLKPILEVNERGLIVTSSSLQTNAPHVWAAGDAVEWRTENGAPTSSGHWTTAKDQGVHIAEDIVNGTSRPFQDAPYFWSMQQGNLLQGVGQFDASTCERHVITGDGPRPSIFVTYLRDGVTVGAFGMNSAKEVLAVRDHLKRSPSAPDAA